MNSHVSYDEFLKEWEYPSPYIVAHTSGSTGSPKEIKLLKSDMIASARATCDFFGINRDSILVTPLSADYIAGKMMAVRALVSHGQLIIETPSNVPLQFFYGHASLVAIVPSQIPGLLESSAHCTIDNVIIGGAPIPATIERTLCDMPFKAYATYGMTETCSHVALRHITPGNDIFTALPGYKFHTDSRSCLIIGSDYLSFKSITTNDIVNIIDTQHFTWLGRYDNVIISGGLKIFPEKVEEAIAHLIPVRFYITGRNDYKWGQHVTLVLEGAPFDTSGLLADIAKTISPHEKPREVIFKKSFETTSSGKIIRT